MFTDEVSCWIDSNSSDVSELLLIKLTNSNNCGLLSTQKHNTQYMYKNRKVLYNTSREERVSNLCLLHQ